MTQRLLLWLFGVALLLVGWPDPAAAQAAPGDGGVRIVELDGHRVRVQSVGLESRRPGEPIVIFEAGATSSLQVWRQVLPRVAEMAPVVAYDRAGLGESEWDGVAPTPRHATTRLRRLLGLIGAEPPYVLVGHSWGGMLAYYYAGYHPGDVAGIVFVDPAPLLTEEASTNLAPFDAIGAGRPGYEAYWSAFSNLVARASPAARAEFDMFRRLSNSERSERDLRPLPQVPVAVIVAAKYLPLPIYDQLPFDGRAYFEADLRQRLAVLQEWALSSSDGMLVVSNRTTHAVPREAPELVVSGVAHVLRRSEPE